MTIKWKIRVCRIGFTCYLYSHSAKDWVNRQKTEHRNFLHHSLSLWNGRPRCDEVHQESVRRRLLYRDGQKYLQKTKVKYSYNFNFMNILASMEKSF